MRRAFLRYKQTESINLMDFKGLLQEGYCMSMGKNVRVNSKNMNKIFIFQFFI